MTDLKQSLQAPILFSVVPSTDTTQKRIWKHLQSFRGALGVKSLTKKGKQQQQQKELLNNHQIKIT